MKDKTVGQHVVEMLGKSNLERHQPLVDTAREMQKNYMPEIEKCINEYDEKDEPFYVIVINKRERLFINVIREYFLARRTLPTPDYDQTVFKYFPKTGDLKFLWSLPDWQTIDYMVENATQIPKEQKELLETCLLFKNETLDAIKGE